MRFLKHLLIGLCAIVLLVAGLAALAVLPAPAQPHGGAARVPPENRLAIPPVLAPRRENGEQVFDLTAQAGATQFFPGKPTATWGYNGSYLGPTLRAQTGDRVRINVTNHLGETTTLHWHGMHLPAAMDGGPHQTIEPGQTWQPSWTITNQAATLWYHPHQMGATGAQVYRGLAGLFIIDDAVSAALDMPREYGVDDIPLVVQDRKFDRDGRLIYEPQGLRAGAPQPAGMVGDTILVNGTRAPYVEVPRKLVRLRVLNGSNGRRYNFGFSDNRAFYQIATDGGLLGAPVARTRMTLGSGERAEILVDLSATETPLTLISFPISGADSLLGGLAQGTFGEGDTNRQFTILELRPRSSKAARSATQQTLPTTLAVVGRLREPDAKQTRQFRLDVSAINNKTMDETRVDGVVKKGDVEIWEVRNESPFYHGFHVHGVQFQVLDRQLYGRRSVAPPYEQGWKDTVIVNPAETVRLILQFTDYSDPHHPYMFHCHILEHEDMGMMGQFVVVDEPLPDVRSESPLPQVTMPAMPAMQH